MNLPVNKHTEIALTEVYGIGRVTANKICDKLGINPSIKLKELSEEEMDKIRVEVTDNYMIEGDLRRFVSMNIKSKVDMGCYEGMRHRRGLPLNGQRTKTNARTRKGKKKPVRNSLKGLLNGI